MKRTGTLSLVIGLIVFVLIVTPSTASSKWPRDGLLLAEAPYEQYDPVAAPDGEGGIILAWSDYRNGSDFVLYVQRIHGDGSVAWTPGGVPLGSGGGYQRRPGIISDGAGGAIIAWEDTRNGRNDVYAQRVDGLGNVLWAANGVPLCTASEWQEEVQVVPDGEGGAIVAWHDDRSGNKDIYARRVSAAGTALWTTNGVALCSASGDQEYHVACEDGEGGAIVAWIDARGSDTDIYAQRINGLGTVQWTTDGVTLCGATDMQTLPCIAYDGGGGAYVAWHDWRAGNPDIYIQSVDATGGVWFGTNGTDLCTDSGNQLYPKMAADGLGSAVVVWEDYRNGDDADIYAQRIGGGGYIEWTTGGLAICTEAGHQGDPIIAPDGEFGTVITWADYRSQIKRDLYSQKVDAAGNIKWQLDGMPQCTAYGSKYCFNTISDGGGGAYIAWEDNRWDPKRDVFAARVHRDGYWAYPAPAITSVVDVSDDQGGTLWVSFAASPIDVSPTQGISYYSLWRAITSPGVPEQALAIDPILLDSPGQAAPGMEGLAVYSTAAASWQLLTTIDAHMLEEYGHPVETLRDSTSANTGWEYFFVSAHGQDPLKFWDSSPDSGYSVDNLAPAAPAALAAEYLGGTDVYLHWNPNTESDFSHYAVYRGSSPGFTPHESNRVATVTLPDCVDNGFGYGEHYYKVSALDSHENESPFSLVTPDDILDVPGSGRGQVNALFQNAPNPFVSSTRIAFSITKAGHVRLTVFDASGRLLRVLADEERRPDSYVEVWDGKDGNGRKVPAGAYFYSLEAPGWKASRKMTLAR
jgi:hypothetical protein